MGWGLGQKAESGVGAARSVGRLVAAVRQEGFVLIRNAMPVAWVDECARAFAPRLQSHIARIGADDTETRNRGPFRHYIDIPACQPFLGITAVGVAMAVVRELLGPEVAVGGMASDTPLARAGGQGSVYQGIHWCVPSRFARRHRDCSLAAGCSAGTAPV